MEFRDLKAQYKKYKTEIDTATETVMLNSDFISGKAVDHLEKRLADYVGVKHCISVANGTEAMTLVMMAWGIGQGDAVFIPDFTFFSTGEIVSFVGATPIFVDVDPKTFNLDPIKLEAAVQKVIEEGVLTPKVVIPVDLFGLPADYDAITKVTSRYDLRILEDGAQGFGGNIRGKRACSFGDAATTSFFPAKPLGCYGDGGAIFTDDTALKDLISSLKVHGKGSNKYDNIRIGVNSRLDTIQAAILNVKLDAFIQHELKDVNQVRARYDQLLSNHVEIPLIPNGYLSSFAQYTIKLKSAQERTKVMEALSTAKIPSLIYYTIPMHRQKAFSYLEPSDEGLEVTIDLCQRVLSLPMHPYLTEDDIELIASTIIAALS